MELVEILDKIEEIINEEDVESAENDHLEEDDRPQKRSALKEIIILVFTFILNLLKAPYRIIARYLKNEIITAIKKDMRLYGAILALLGIVFLFSAVLWIFIAIAVGAYFYDQGATLFVSVLYSIAFQFVSILLVSLTAYITSKQVRSVKLLKSLSKPQV